MHTKDKEKKGRGKEGNVREKKQGGAGVKIKSCIDRFFHVSVG